MATKLTIQQAFELRRVAPSATSTQRKPAFIVYWISQSTLVALSVVFGFLVAFAVQRKLGQTADEDEDEGEGDYRKALALAVSLSAVFLVLFAKRFQNVSKQVAQATAESVMIHTPVKPTVAANENNTLTPKQLRLIGCTPQELNEHRKQVDSILSPTPASAVKTKPSNGTPAPPPSSTATPAKSSVHFTTASTPVGSPLRIVSQDDSKYLSPQSPLVYQAPRTPTAAVTSPFVSSNLVSTTVLVSPGLPAPPPPSTSMAVMQLKNPAKKPVSDEQAASALVDQVEKEGNFNMDDAVSNFKRALYEYIKSEVLGRLDDVHDKLAAIKVNSNQWYPRTVLEWEELKDVQEMHSFQIETLSMTDRQELRRLMKQRKQLEKYFEVKRRGNMVPFPRNYVLKRLRNLIKNGKEFSAFRSFGGETFNRGTAAATEWNSDELPTDAEILFRIVCVWFDKCLKREMVGSLEDSVEEDSFSLLHVREEAAATTTANREWWGFVACGTSTSTSTAAASMDMLSPLAHSTFHPHWKVMVGGKVWEVCYGRSNLFHAVVLFLYSLRANVVDGRVNDIVTEVFGKQ